MYILYYYYILYITSMDHTYGTGYGNYLHLETGSMEEGKEGRLESKQLTQVNEKGDCFMFWYYLAHR